MPLRFANAALAALIAVAALNTVASASDDRRVGQSKIRLFGITVPVASHKTVILNDPEAPVQITEAGTYRLEWGSPKKGGNRLVMALPARRFKDIPKGPIVTISAISETAVAVEFRVLFYDTFNQYRGGLAAVRMGAPRRRMRWKHRELSFTFEGYGIACIFVRYARLADGTVWEMDERKVATMMMVDGCGSNSEKDALSRINETVKGALRI